MTGLPTLTVELDDTTGSGTWPHDITQYVNLPAGWSIDRGRSNEFGENETGGLSLQVDNTDGRFTLGNTTYDLAVDQRIRFTESVGATVSRRHVGYVQDWPQRWDSPLAKKSLVKVISKDRFSRLERRDMPAESLIAAEILTDGPVAYYTLGEPTDATTAGDTSGNGHPALTVAGAGTAVVFGQAVGPAYDNLTAAQFTIEDQYLQAADSFLSGAAFTLVIFAQFPALTIYTGPSFAALIPTGQGACLFSVLPSGKANFLVAGNSPGQVTSTSVVVDNTTHCLTFVYDGVQTLKLYVDGVLEDTQADAGNVVTASTLQHLYLGADGLATPARVLQDSTLSHAALFDGALSAARIAAHASAGLTGATTDSSDERLGRLATFARIPTAERDFEAGVLTGVGAQIGEAKVLPAMHAVVKAEGGSLFVSGDGKLTAHNRTHRVLTSTQAASLVISAADVDPGDLLVSRDKQYLKNAVTGSRREGAVQRVVDDASELQYEEYPDSDLSDLLVLTDPEVLDAITWRAGAYAQPLDRLASITLDLFTLPDSVVEDALALELGDRITVTDLPTTSPLASIDLLIEGIKESGSLSAWRLTFNTVPAALFQAWVLGDTTYGVLDSTTRLHW